MVSKREIIEAFLSWYPNDPHASHEDSYLEIINANYLNSLSKEAFIEFFFQFAREGGKVQSGGPRTADLFKQNMKERYDEFRNMILQPFSPNFDLERWLNSADDFTYFGQGMATVYLNRVDKNKFVIVNEKVIDALPYLGYEKPTGTTLIKKYNQIKAVQTSLIQEFPALENFYKVDALMHFLIETPEGKQLIAPLIAMEYFDLKGLKAYAQMVRQDYDKQHPAATWYKKTQQQLQHLVYLLADKLGRDLKINYTERPKGMGGRGKFVFRDYVLTGFSTGDLFPSFPSPKGDLFMKLFFAGLGEKPVFALEVDVNFSNAQNPFNPQRDDIREKTYMEFAVDEHFPKDWNALLDLIENPSKTLIDQFIQIAKGKEITKTKVVPDIAHQLNTILYGSPGTGKTYRTIDHALSIIDGKKSTEAIAAERENDRNGDIKRTFDDLMKAGRIAFCTFHQSMGYEDFIEGIKPLRPDADEDKPMQYAVVDGIFKRLCTEAIFELASLATGEPTDRVVDFSLAYDRFVADVQERLSRGEPTVMKTVTNGNIVVDSISQQNNLIVKHRGFERIYTVSKHRLSRLANAIPDLKAVSNISAEFTKIIGGMNASVYWAALNAIRNFEPQAGGQLRDLSGLTYEDKKEAIRDFELPENIKEKAKRFVLIIDEINRGNVAQIFGELITLIEDDKRMGEKTALKAMLPYSNESFAVPPNLYIIGTMNTADRSVEALDTALRRRFSFIHMRPEPDKLNVTQEGIDLNNMLTRINKRLEVLLDADHTIGHAWLWGVNDLTGLRLTFKDKILPLLQEFFYNDYEKIGLVLGDAFVQSKPVDPKAVFANFTNGNGLADEYATSRLFYLKDIKDVKAEDFSAI